jgi:hypothetical protein
MGDWSVYDYGLPFTRDPATILAGASAGPEDDLYLSTRTFDASGTLLRSTYVRYEKDVPGSSLAVEHTRDMNQRRVAERTVYHDDNGRWTQRELSSFDGLGHYRTVVETGSFESSPRRTTTTNFHPGRHYKVDSFGRLVGSYSMIPASSPWILSTYDSRTVSLSEGSFNGTSRVETTFDPETGFLECRRELKGTGRGHDDVLVVFTDLDGDGFPDREAFYGGDRQRLPTPPGCGVADGLEAEVRLDHAYAFGVLKSTDYAQECSGAGDGGHVLRVVDLDIDRRTGLPRASRDVSGLRTDFLYDDLGRLTTVRPLQDAWTVTTYTPAGPHTAAVATVFRRNAGSTTRLSQERRVFDGFGRVCVTQEKLPSGGLWSRRDTLYHPTGWKKEESVVRETNALATRCPTQITGPKTTYAAYDPFGRAGRIVPPDGAAHEILLTYRGVRQVDRTVRVATSLSGSEVSATTSEPARAPRPRRRRSRPPHGLLL